jgi:hypothetical protein
MLWHCIADYTEQSFELTHGIGGIRHWDSKAEAAWSKPKPEARERLD